jgi:hypothetical protein
VGELVRLDFKPRAALSGERAHQEWFKKDGTPLRRKVNITGADGKPLALEVESEYKEADGRLLLAAQKPVDSRVRFSMEFEYEKLDGFRVLKRSCRRPRRSACRVQDEDRGRAEVNRRASRIALLLALAAAPPAVLAQAAPPAPARDAGARVVGRIRTPGSEIAVSLDAFTAFVLVDEGTSPDGAVALDFLVQEQVVAVEAQRRGLSVDEPTLDRRIRELDAMIQKSKRAGYPRPARRLSASPGCARRSGHRCSPGR